MPTPEKRYSQPELEKIYRDNELDKKLPLCNRFPICDEEYTPESGKKFRKRRGYRYLDSGTNHDVAVIFHYTLHDGTQLRIINRLVIDGNVYNGQLS